MHPGVDTIQFAVLVGKDLCFSQVLCVQAQQNRSDHHHHLQQLPPSVLEYSRNVVEDAHAPRIKDVCTVQQLKSVKNNVWCLEGVGCQLVLEGFQLCLAYCSLRELED